MSVLFWLVAGHFIADYPLQNDFIAKYKCPANSLEAVPWYYVLTAHAFTHGAAVALATGMWQLGLGETIAHWLIDLGKCRGNFGIHIDQGFHIGFKFFWFGCFLAEANK